MINSVSLRNEHSLGCLKTQFWAIFFAQFLSLAILIEILVLTGFIANKKRLIRWPKTDIDALQSSCFNRLEKYYRLKLSRYLFKKIKCPKKHAENGIFPEVCNFKKNACILIALLFS